jgi:hypothetical protein
MKFRIVLLIHRVSDLQLENDGNASLEYVIEKKNFWGIWKEVFVKEVHTARITHETYADAEAYMLVNYMGHGMCRNIGNEYSYKPYEYFM